MREVGFKTSFTFKKGMIFEIKEILVEPNFSMPWTWNTGICPHCKNRIDRTVTHEFSSIEILISETIKPEKALVEDLILGGHTRDGRYMLIPKEHYNTILKNSQLFSRFVEE